VPPVRARRRAAELQNGGSSGTSSVCAVPGTRSPAASPGTLLTCMPEADRPEPAATVLPRSTLNAAAYPLATRSERLNLHGSTTSGVKRITALGVYFTRKQRRATPTSRGSSTRPRCSLTAGIRSCMAVHGCDYDWTVFSDGLIKHGGSFFDACILARRPMPAEMRAGVRRNQRPSPSCHLDAWA
jgi:hypothetical protein